MQGLLTTKYATDRLSHFNCSPTISGWMSSGPGVVSHVHMTANDCPYDTIREILCDTDWLLYSTVVGLERDT